MPAAVAIPLITAGVGAGTQLYAANRANKANNRGMDMHAKATADALAFAREQEATRRMEWDREQNELKRQWDTRESNAMPFRQAAAGVLRSRYAGGQAPGLAALVTPRKFNPEPYKPGTLGDLAR